MIKLSTNSWIFQANPKCFDIDKAVGFLQDIPWRVNVFINHVRKGDSVFIWRSGNNGGIIAVGTVFTDISDICFNDKELEFVADRGLYLFKFPHKGVRVRVTKVLQKPITKIFLKDHPVLARMSIMRNPQGSVFKLMPREICAIESIIDDFD